MVFINFFRTNKKKFNPNYEGKEFQNKVGEKNYLNGRTD